ncbi:hypothetical protein OIU77_025943 [Salix suchowensis]|uniref:PSII 6.1 kDa protein n=1 Tax=Salix suchowensis TaxID=1278906 RepID=A0ABQ9BXZ8_9ROSI|nr:hypothetical protein OIU77_025943 [Salix suchowensis]
MATITASAATSSIVRAALARKPSVGLSSSSVLGLPAMAKKEKLWVLLPYQARPLALVDERLSTEGTGLPFGLSNNLLVWILLGVFSLIWSLYFVYTSSLDEDDDSGLSL